MNENRAIIKKYKIEREKQDGITNNGNLAMKKRKYDESKDKKNRAGSGNVGKSRNLGSVKENVSILGEKQSKNVISKNRN